MAFTIQEIIDIAIGIEETGYEFYIQCGSKFKNPAMSDVFDFLAREEMAHKELFRSLRRQDEAMAIIPEEYSGYLKAIGGGRVFAKQKMDMEQILAGINSPMDAVKHAFEAEKESILFYGEMKSLYPNESETRSLLDRIIAEERKHVTTLVDLLEKIRLI
jgi:rubrerythrin